MMHVVVALWFCCSVVAASAQTLWPNQREGDFVILDFQFASGERLAEVKLHCTTLGTPPRNAAGDGTNAVLLLHGTSGTGKTWLVPDLANELFAAGQPLDASQYFIILPDGIGIEQAERRPARQVSPLSLPRHDPDDPPARHRWA